MKTIAVLMCLLITSCGLIAQDKATAVPDVDEPNAPSRLFEWNAKSPGELSHWLNENKRLLKRCDICDLSVFWWDEETKASSSVQNVAYFLVGPADEQVTRLIQHVESGVGVRVGVQYFPLKPEILQIRIALALEGTPDDIFNEISRTKTETVREKEWKFLTSTKDVRIKNLRYTFSLSCTNSKNSFLTRSCCITPIRPNGINELAGLCNTLYSHAPEMIR